LTNWAAIGEQRILLYPTPYKPVTLRVDGKVLPTPLTDFTSTDPANDTGARLSIPYQYQESFIAYVEALALDRENDDRAPGKKQEALYLIKQDIQSDDMRLGDNINPRVRHWFEQGNQGNAQQLNSILWATLSGDDY